MYKNAHNFKKRLHLQMKCGILNKYSYVCMILGISKMQERQCIDAVFAYETASMQVFELKGAL